MLGPAPALRRADPGSALCAPEEPRVGGVRGLGAGPFPARSRTFPGSEQDLSRLRSVLQTRAAVPALPAVPEASCPGAGQVAAPPWSTGRGAGNCWALAALPSLGKEWGAPGSTGRSLRAARLCTVQSPASGRTCSLPVHTWL